VRGQTIHSFFGFAPSVTPDSYNISLRAKAVGKLIETMVIDEISMVRADLLDCIDLALQEIRKNTMPFGGVRMIFVGDLYQLSPVVSTFGDEKLIFGGNTYNSPFFFDSMAFHNFNYRKINLTQVYRQKDTWFINFLNNVRIGEVDYASLSRINKTCVVNTANPFTVFLASTNRMVDEMNNKKMNELDTEEFYHQADITGSIQVGQMPTEEHLSLKVGCQLMLVNNDKQGRWVNGTTGMLESVGSTTYTKTIYNEEEDIYEEAEIESPCLHIRLSNNNRITVTPNTWEVTVLELNKNKVSPKTIGTFTQFPVRVAWAFTVHKSQGKTYDHVAIKFDHRPMYSPGQLYVALSRCTSLEGIRLSRPIRMSDVVTSKKVKEFYAHV
jgi:ATP-dependent exoDNAse (exonuclease V) alpha subunit